MKHNCDICGNEFEARSVRDKYCSKKCLAIGRERSRTKVELVCQTCGDTYMVRKDHIGRSKYCSKTCHGKEIVKGVTYKNGTENGAWKGDSASQYAGRARAEKMYEEQPCEVCPNLKGERHHIDGNTLNNAPENILFVCKSCHAILEAMIRNGELEEIMMEITLG